jgi:hypothetical protein
MSQFRITKDKYESLYIFVVHGATIEFFIEKVNKILGIIDQIQNTIKKNYIKKRLYLFLEYLSNIKSETIIDNIFLIDDMVHTIDLEKSWKKTLVHFQCDPVTVKYDDTYKIDWLKSYLLDETYTNVIHVKNNDLKHYHLNSTKKRLHSSQTSKNMNMQTYMETNIPAKQICIVHGVSAALKTINDSLDGFTKIYKCDKRDDEILLDIDKIQNVEVSKQLDIWLSKLLDPKEGSKIVFGKDIKTSIQNKMLKTLFCSPDVALQVNQKISQELRVFDLIIVKSHGVDVGKRLATEFSGAIGIKFY